MCGALFLACVLCISLMEDLVHKPSHTKNGKFNLSSKQRVRHIIKEKNSQERSGCIVASLPHKCYTLTTDGAKTLAETMEQIHASDCSDISHSVEHTHSYKCCFCSLIKYVASYQQTFMVVKQRRHAAIMEPLAPLWRQHTSSVWVFVWNSIHSMFPVMLIFGDFWASLIFYWGLTDEL